MISLSYIVVIFALDYILITMTFHIIPTFETIVAFDILLLLCLHQRPCYGVKTSGVLVQSK
jgi:hypothetical protein